MGFSNEISDDAALAELGRRMARYRLNRDVTQADLAREAGVSLGTLQRLEHGASTNTVNLVRILRSLELLGNLDSVAPDPAVSPLQQMKTRKKERSRASSRSGGSETKGPWTWGDEE